MAEINNIMCENIPEWIPNWENPCEYPDPATTSMKEWAWEFLRRNEEYQRDYNNIYKTIKPSRPEDLHLVKNFFNYQKNNGGLGKFFDKDDPANAPETICNMLELYGSSYLIVVDKHKQIILKYEISVPFNEKLPNPSNRLTSPEIFKSTHAAMHLPGTNKFLCMTKKEDIEKQIAKQLSEPTKTREIIIKRHPQELIFSIDLSENINSQIEAIKSIAVQAQNKAKKLGLYEEARCPQKNAENYQLYLRSYDAHVLRGISTSEIAAHLHPEIPNEDPDYHARKRVNNYITAAKTLISQDYRKLASHP